MELDSNDYELKSPFNLQEINWGEVQLIVTGLSQRK
jgi:hypothetical protein